MISLRELALIGGKENLVKALLIVNDAPYGIERTYNALRVAGALSKREGVELKKLYCEDNKLSPSKEPSWLNGVTYGINRPVNLSSIAAMRSSGSALEFAAEPSRTESVYRFKFLPIWENRRI